MASGCPIGIPRAPGTAMRRVLCFQPHYSKSGAFIAQIAAMKTAFARGRTADVSTSAVSGQTVMLTKRGQRMIVSAYNADGTTKWPTMMIVSHAVHRRREFYRNARHMTNRFQPDADSSGKTFHGRTRDTFRLRRVEPTRTLRLP